MFLIRQTMTASLVTLVALMASAATPIRHLEDGFYVRTDGVVRLCRAFELPKGMNARRTIEIAYIYAFENGNSSHRVKSDLDEDCEFAVTNTRENLGDRTVLTKQTAEICDDKVKSDITTKLTIRPGKLRLDLEDKMGPGYFCEWVKAIGGRETSN